MLRWNLSGTEGFEPPSNRTKTRCLTAWPRPIYVSIQTRIYINIGIGCSSIPAQYLWKKEVVAEIRHV